MSEKVRKKVNRDIFGNATSSQGESGFPANEELAGRRIQGRNSFMTEAHFPPLARARNVLLSPSLFGVIV
jgi:hypothetical protein